MPNGKRVSKIPKQYVVYVWEIINGQEIGPLHEVFEGKNKDEALKNAKKYYKGKKVKIKVMGRY